MKNMKYQQSVIVKDISMEAAKSAFNDINFLKHLIALQPVKVVKWDGTFDGAVAHMRFWFFGWKDFIVEHNSNEEKRSSFSFKDTGSTLPFGLTKCEHTHKVMKINSDINIIDIIHFKCKSKILGALVYPILIAPIFIRKILYQTYNWKSKKS